MEWFKFYKKDYLTDTKLIGIDPLLRLIWVTLLCLCDDDGQIKYLRETDLIRMAGCDDDMLNDLTDFERVKGCLSFFEERGMVALQSVTNSNADRNASVTYHVTLCNYLKRQTTKLSNAERQKKYREVRKLASKTEKKQRNDSNVTQRNDSNAREEKIRVDKNRIDNNKDISLVKTSKNSHVPCTLTELSEISTELGIPLEVVKKKHQDIMEMIQVGEFDKRKNKTVFFTLKRWLDLDMKKGYVRKNPGVISI